MDYIVDYTYRSDALCDRLLLITRYGVVNSYILYLKEK